jgi:tetratricopeptide (TPR) repeat protein
MQLRFRAVLLSYLGISDHAVEMGEQALSMARTLDVASYELAALNSLAFVQTRAGQHKQAVDLCVRQVQLCQELGDSYREAIARAVLGDALCGLGRVEEAVSSWLSAATLFQGTHAHRFYALCQLRIGQAYEAMKLVPEAVTCLEESVVVFRRLRIVPKIEEAQATLERCRAAC